MSLVACLTILLAFPRTASALPCFDELYQYYTDETYTTLMLLGKRAHDS
jgi:hypothetical protein